MPREMGRVNPATDVTTGRCSLTAYIEKFLPLGLNFCERIKSEYNNTPTHGFATNWIANPCRR
jgi:hypothetical protein